MKRYQHIILKNRGKIVHEEESNEGEISMKNTAANTVSVGADRTYNVGNYESVRIHIGYSKVLEEGDNPVKVGRKMAKILPAELDFVFKAFCKEQGLKRKVEDK